MKEKAVAFYERDGISWQTPGLHDTIKVIDKHTGEKVTAQKKYLLMSIAEAKELFDQENNNEISIGMTSFFNLKPDYVLPFNKMPQNVCVCTVHANFYFIADAILPYLNKLQVTSYKSLIKLTCCDETIEDCMVNNSCDKCKYWDEKSYVDSNTNIDERIKFKKWEKVNERLQVADHEESLSTAAEYFNKMLFIFKRHSFVKKIQSDQFQNKKKILRMEKLYAK